MRAAAWRLRKRLGRRGTFLLIIGVGKVCWGAGFILTPQPNPQGVSLLTDIAPLHCWAWLWVLAGLVTGGSAFVRVGRDGLGFVAALIPPALWATAYLVAAVSGEFSRGLWVALWYLTSHVGAIMWASTVPEYSVPPAPRSRKGRAG
ncbi:hypothetical protein [Streptomyces sp. NPDC053079]|uniref:hypothetical protein n=1 Tax=Streptomyces sp. NPDC053079 TaxID=3365697 RepID=UPI0037D940AA